MERRLAAILAADMGNPESAQHPAADLLSARPDFTVENWALTQNCLDPNRLARDRASLVSACLP